MFTNSASGFAPADQVARWRAQAAPDAARILDGGVAAIERIPVHPRFARRLPPDIYDALLADSTGLSPLGIANTLCQTSTNANVRDIVSGNPRPALLCYGSKEKRFAAMKVWAEENMARLATVDLQAGHAVNMEDSKGFNAAACEFITQHAP